MMRLRRGPKRSVLWEGGRWGCRARLGLMRPHVLEQTTLHLIVQIAVDEGKDACLGVERDHGVLALPVHAAWRRLARIAEPLLQHRNDVDAATAVEGYLIELLRVKIEVQVTTPQAEHGLLVE